MAHPSRLRPGRPPGAPASLVRMLRCPVSLYRFLYTEVGRRHRWTDRLAWSDETMGAYLATEGLELWLLLYESTPAGYAELQRMPAGRVEIVYFGLLPEFIGLGLGGWFLGEAVARAWEGGTQVVTLNTCTFDHAHALANYQARGFEVERREEYEV
jgi:GNAT superfamily N-acetyltransferase